VWSRRLGPRLVLLGQPCKDPAIVRAQREMRVPARPQRPTDTRGAERAAGLAASESAILVLHHIEAAQNRGRVDLRRRRKPWWRRGQVIFLTALAVAAYVLAILFGPNSRWHEVFAAWKLFPSGFPGYQSDVTWEYLLAEHLAALVSLFVTIKVVGAIFGERVTEFRARRRKDHAVVCGLGTTGLRSVRVLLDGGHAVTCLDTDASGDAADDARGEGALVLRRDATSVSALEAARIDRASIVVCTGPDDATNTRIASLAAGIVHTSPTGRNPSIHVDIRDPDLAQLLRAPLASVGAARLHFFNAASVWARAMLDHPSGPFTALAPLPRRIAVLGESSLAVAVVVGAARRRHRHATTDGNQERLTIVVVGATAAETCRSLRERYPALTRFCELRPVPHRLAAAAPLDVAAVVGEADHLDAAYACVDDQSANLALALDAEQRLGDEAPVFLPANAAAAALGPLLIGVGRIRPVALPEDADAFDLIHDSMREELARAVHEAYLASHNSESESDLAPADRPWNALSEEFRRASRAHADGVVEQLRAVWYEIEPQYDWDEDPPHLTANAIEAMAELEHARWCRERLAAGWRHGVPKDYERRIHDLLVSWAQLENADKDTDRLMVSRRPEILAAAGFRLRYDPIREELARRLHERYVEARRTEGQSGPFIASWAELDEAGRDLNRNAIDHIAVKLARIGRRAVPAIVAPSTMRIHFNSEELELMAAAEHERWLHERDEAGWTRGPRDDSARRHPSLVPWEALAESEREKDREIVRALPGLLESVGYTVVGITGH
jgi:voltage-gated potassium channel Kch